MCDFHSRLEPLLATAVVHDRGRAWYPRPWQRAIGAHWLPAWSELFSRHLGPELPHTIEGPCLSEFAASAAAIRRQPKAFWAAARDWVLATDMPPQWVSRVWEVTWHWLLTGQAEWYHEQGDCFCELYSACTPDPPVAQQD